MQMLVPTKRGPGKDKQGNGDRVTGAQGSMMHMGSEGWSGPRPQKSYCRLNCLKSVCDGKGSEVTVHHSVCLKDAFQSTNS